MSPNDGLHNDYITKPWYLGGHACRVRWHDDFDALGYVLVCSYPMCGKLAWQGLKAKHESKYLLVLKKQGRSEDILCMLRTT